MEAELEDKIRVFALDNAVKFNGKANPGAVKGKILAESPDLKKDMKTVSKAVNDIIKKVNQLSPEKQKEQLEKGPKDIIKEKVHEERSIFQSLKIGHEQWDKKLVSAFPPEPSKYPHIGHAKAILVNYGLAKEYDGKFILRYEDTNPSLAKEEFYKIHLDNYKWLGIEPDKIDYASDHMDRFYEEAEKLIESGNAYVCSCPQEKVKESRAKGVGCACREKKPDENMKAFERMAKAMEGELILRMRIDLKHKNSTMRDPTIMRIIDAPHCRTKTKYRVWPNYDLENSVMDGIEGVTHRVRSKEFEMRNELQRHIQKLLGFKETSIFEFGRFEIEGATTSGREIRDKIESGELSGWDDPSLVTIVALRRRGFQEEAIKQFVLATGVTKAESTMTWDDLIVQNKRLLDKRARRYFFVEEPVEVTIKGAPAQKVELRKHPEMDLGTRELKTGESFYLAKSDFDQLEDQKLYRLMDCLNFRLKGKELEFESLPYEKFKKDGTRIIHWLPKGEGLRTLNILMPDKQVKEGLAEQTVDEIALGEVVQFERFGFCRRDTKNDATDTFVFTHR